MVKLQNKKVLLNLQNCNENAVPRRACGCSTNRLEDLVALCSGGAGITRAATYKYDTRRRCAITRLWNFGPIGGSGYLSPLC